MSELQHIDYPPDARQAPLFLRSVRIRNYKSIGKCDVRLSSLTVLVGRNGSGKSNFVDALRFVVDSLETSLDLAIRSRGGIESVRRLSTGHPRNFAIELELQLSEWRIATYGFEIAARERGGFVVNTEHARIRHPSGESSASYRLDKGTVIESSLTGTPPSFPDRLYLVNVAGFPEFRALYDALLSMGFYNLNPDAMRQYQTPDAGELLHRDGSNIASVIGRLAADGSNTKERIQAYLQTIVPGITGVERVPLGPSETLIFFQEVAGSQHPWKFYAASVSDGTLRALGSLVAVTQLAGRGAPVRLVGIEEPETALHPAAAGALMGALKEAASNTQIVVTTHSPDLLDQVDPDSEELLVVTSERGTTQIAPADPASLKAIESHLYSAGELLRMDQLQPDQESVKRQQQLRLFDNGEEDT